MTFYVMIKPPPAVAAQIDAIRRRYDIAHSYAADRLHVTVWPLAALPAGAIGLLLPLLAAVRAEPFGVSFDRIDGNALIGGAGTQGVRTLRRAIARVLARAGFPLTPYDAAPHVSLAYGDRPVRRIAIPPVRWRVDAFSLIRSGDGRHHELGRWPLAARQGDLFA